MGHSQMLEWSGSALSSLGAFLLATHTRGSRYRWVAFMAANIVLIGFFIGTHMYGLVLMPVAFLATSILGIYRSGLLSAWWPRKAAAPGETT